MQVTFTRQPGSRDWGYVVIERDDGVVYRMPDRRGGPGLPHDLRHLIVERELGVTDGIWGGIAAGMVFKSMEHVRGRRPPHSAQRSAELIRTYRDRLLRAELLAITVEAIAELQEPSPAAIRSITLTKLSLLRGTGPSDETFAAAARAMQVETARWARLRAGQELRYEWRSGLADRRGRFSLHGQAGRMGQPERARRAGWPGRAGAGTGGWGR
jgi:hypothetical protein